jgi:hypothetical protein
VKVVLLVRPMLSGSSEFLNFSLVFVRCHEQPGVSLDAIIDLSLRVGVRLLLMRVSLCLRHSLTSTLKFVLVTINLDPRRACVPLFVMLWLLNRGPTV